jgi:putative methyltransferase (TIGR04325 family)
MLLPLIELYRRLKYFKYGWQGNYKTWQEAKEQCTGYNAETIIQKVRSGALKVKNGEAVYEKDSVLYDHIIYSWPLLANLLYVASKNNNQLSVLDFGGALGTSYFQNRAYLNHISNLQWSVVEQKEFVAIGKEEMSNEILQFYYTIDEALEAGKKFDVFIFSGALPYFEKPYELMQSIMDYRFPYIILDLTYFNPEPGDRITIQKVPPYYYEASYPAWFLDYNKLKNLMLTKYDLVAEHMNEETLFLYGKKVPYQGFTMKLKES